MSVIRRPWLPSFDRDDLGPEMREQPLGVVAGRLAFDHGGVAGRGEPREQHRRFDLRGGDRRAVDDRERVARALQRQRQPAALGARHDRAPINSSGSRMRRIGRVRSEASPSKVAVIGQPATAPITRRQPVPELPKSSAARAAAKPADADPAHAPGAVAGALDVRAERPHRLWRY